MVEDVLIKVHWSFIVQRTTDNDKRCIQRWYRDIRTNLIVTTHVFWIGIYKIFGNSIK